MSLSRDQHQLAAWINDLQADIGKGNSERGFHEEGDKLRHQAHNPALTSSQFMGAGLADEPVAALRNYYMAKVGLIVTEAAEALEDLRCGRPVNENYYTENGAEVVFSDDARGVPLKPEGVPSEIADIVIRCFDFADEAKFSLIEVILEKLTYNDTRARLHGKGF